MRNHVYFIILGLFCIVVFRRVNLSKDAESVEKPLSRTNPKVEEYDVKKFNGTLFIKFVDSKKVSKVEIGDDIKKVIFRIGKEKRIHFNLVESKGKQTAVLTLRKYQGNVILIVGDQTVTVETSNAEEPGHPHVGMIFI